MRRTKILYLEQLVKDMDYIEHQLNAVRGVVLRWKGLASNLRYDEYQKQLKKNGKAKSPK